MNSLELHLMENIIHPNIIKNQHIKEIKELDGEKRVILSDCALCAIVRDEKMNPAGGIKKFVDSHVPFVEEAVIVDTGSIDGTREILEELESQYPNLKVHDIKFKGFADARNYSLDYAHCKYAFSWDTAF